MNNLLLISFIISGINFCQAMLPENHGIHHVHANNVRDYESYKTTIDQHTCNYEKCTQELGEELWKGLSLQADGTPAFKYELLVLLLEDEQSVIYCGHLYFSRHKNGRISLYNPGFNYQSLCPWKKCFFYLTNKLKFLDGSEHELCWEHEYDDREEDTRIWSISNICKKIIGENQQAVMPPLADFKSRLKDLGFRETPVRNPETNQVIRIDYVLGLGIG